MVIISEPNHGVLEKQYYISIYNNFIYIYKRGIYNSTVKNVKFVFVSFINFKF